LRDCWNKREASAGSASRLTTSGVTHHRSRHNQHIGSRRVGLTLERARLIRRRPGVARSIELAVDPQVLPTLQPILG